MALTITQLQAMNHLQRNGYTTGELALNAIAYHASAQTMLPIAAQLFKKNSQLTYQNIVTQYEHINQEGQRRSVFPVPLLRTLWKAYVYLRNQDNVRTILNSICHHEASFTQTMAHIKESSYTDFKQCYIEQDNFSYTMPINRLTYLALVASGRQSSSWFYARHSYIITYHTTKNLPTRVQNHLTTMLSVPLNHRTPQTQNYAFVTIQTSPTLCDVILRREQHYFLLTDIPLPQPMTHIIQPASINTEINTAIKHGYFKHFITAENTIAFILKRLTV